MFDLSKIEIDPQFAAFLPPLTDEEAAALRAQVEREGFRDGWVAWLEPETNRLLLIDGHNRHGLWKEGVGGPVPAGRVLTEADGLKTRDHVLVWIARQHIGRRNLTRQQLTYYLGLEYNAEKQPWGGNRKQSITDETLKPDTASKIAKKRGVSRATVNRAGKFAEKVDAAPPEERAALLSGEKPAEPAPADPPETPRDRALKALKKAQSANKRLLECLRDARREMQAMKVTPVNVAACETNITEIAKELEAGLKRVKFAQLERQKEFI